MPLLSSSTDQRWARAGNNFQTHKTFFRLCWRFIRVDTTKLTAIFFCYCRFLLTAHSRFSPVVVLVVVVTLWTVRLLIVAPLPHRLYNVGLLPLPRAALDDDGNVVDDDDGDDDYDGADHDDCAGRKGEQSVSLPPSSTSVSGNHPHTLTNRPINVKSLMRFC